MLEPLLESAASLLGPVDLVDDLTFSDKALVARLRITEGATVVAKRPTLGQALHATLRHGTPEEPEELEAGRDEMRQLAGALDVPVPRGVDDDVASIASMLARPGPWVAFCPSDTCPDNNRVLPDGSVRLFDFEGAGWRHAALEASYCRAPFCTCWCLARLPEGMVGRMEAAFLGALAPTDPTGFSEVVTPAAVHYTVVQFRWFRRFVLDERPVPPRAPSTGRQNVYVRLLAVAAEREKLPALAEVSAGLATAIVRRWPDAAGMPLYPAFR